jgi:HEXXH motif-containing protein
MLTTSTSAQTARNDALERHYRPFACPQPGGDERVMEVIATTYSSGLLEQFLAAYEDRVAAASNELRSLMHAGRRGMSFEVAWDWRYCQVMRAIDGRHPSPLRVAVEIALLFMKAGASGAWEVELDDAVELRWDRWLLPATRRLRVESDGRRALVQLRGAEGTRAITFLREALVWHSPDYAPLPNVVTGHGLHVPLLSASSLSAELPNSEHIQRARIVPSIDDATVRAFQDGFDMLAGYAPAYLPWVERVIRDIAVEIAPEDRILSGSAPDSPGLIASSIASPAAIGEMLVHEGAHQYYHLLTYLGPVDDGSDTSTYYSPAVRRPRPLSRILVAYHAFANVLLFYRACLKQGVQDRGYCSQNEERLRDEVAQLEAPLAGNPALTPLGRALVEPLMERLRGSV